MKHLCNIGWSSKQFVKTNYIVEIKNLAWEYGTAWIVSKDQLIKIIDADPFYFRNLDRSRLNAGYYAISVVEEID